MGGPEGQGAGAAVEEFNRVEEAMSYFSLFLSGSC